MASFKKTIAKVINVCKEATAGPWHSVEPGPEDSFGETQVHAEYTGKVTGAVVEIAVMRQSSAPDAEFLVTARALLGPFAEALQQVDQLADECADDSDAGIRLVAKSLRSILHEPDEKPGKKPVKKKRTGRKEVATNMRALTTLMDACNKATAGPWFVSDAHGLCVVSKKRTDARYMTMVADLTPDEELGWEPTREDAEFLATSRKYMSRFINTLMLLLANGEIDASRVRFLIHEMLREGEFGE